MVSDAASDKRRKVVLLFCLTIVWSLLEADGIS